MAESKDYLGRIQILRFFAAFGVLVAHLQHEVATRLMPAVPFRQFNAIDGGLGVDVFFVISGFIMYYISSADFGKGGAAASFISRRFLRVAPLYYLATMLLLLTIMLLADHVETAALTAQQVTATFLFLPWPNAAGQVVPILKLGWTLNYEAYFYAVFAVALAFPKRFGLTVLAAVIVLVALLAQIMPGRSFLLDFWGAPIVLEFLGGIAVAILYQRGSRLPTAVVWLMVIGALALTVLLRVSGLAGELPRAVFSGIPAALIVAGVALGPSGGAQTPMRRAFEAAGSASYALYLFHPFAIRGGALLWARLGAPAEPWLFIAAIALLATAVSVAINLAVEQPLDRRLRRLVGRRSAPLRSVV